MLNNNYFRLSNDIILLLGQSEFNSDMGYHENTDAGLIQFYESNRNGVSNIADIDKPGVILSNFRPEHTQYVKSVEVQFLVRQNYDIGKLANGWILQLMTSVFDEYINKQFRVAYSVNISSDAIRPVDPITIDGSVFYSTLTLTIPHMFFVNLQNTMYHLSNDFKINLEGSTLTRYVENYTSSLLTPLDKLYNFSFMGKDDLSIGNIENYVRLDKYSGFIEIGLVSVDDSITLEGAIYSQLGLQNQRPKIEAFHNIMYGFTDSMEATVNDVEIETDVVLSNNSNGIYPVMYRPLLRPDDPVRSPKSVNKILYLMVETIVRVGQTQFTRFSEVKFDYSDFFSQSSYVQVNEVTVNHNITHEQKIINEKEIIKPVIVTQYVGFNIANKQQPVDYMPDTSIGFVDVAKSDDYILTNNVRYKLAFYSTTKDGFLDKLVETLGYKDVNGVLLFDVPEFTFPPSKVHYRLYEISDKSTASIMVGDVNQKLKG